MQQQAQSLHCERSRSQSSTSYRTMLLVLLLALCTVSKVFAQVCAALSGDDSGDYWYVQSRNAHQPSAEC
jgi:hypothetical protein